MDHPRLRRCLWRPGGKNSKRSLQRKKVGIRVLCYDLLPPSPPNESLPIHCLPWGNAVAHFYRRPPVRYIWRAAQQEHQVRQCRDLVNGCEWGAVYLRICSYCCCEVWCLLEGERFVFPVKFTTLSRDEVLIWLCAPTATNVEGIFRLSGSAKRIKDLQTIFNSPDKYGKGLDWTGYTVHDAANIFRRYLNQLPEPIIPLDFYARFREPLQCAPEHFDAHAAIRSYQALIGKLPALNRQLLLYILDLLAVFASKSEQNLMNASNLAAIFQPGLINHPEHDMSPGDYKLSQDVLVFLITNQDHFLLGMRGSVENEGIDSLIVPEVSRTPASPRRSRTLISRSPSASSAGADDVRKYGNLRRNVSVTSRRSTAGSTVVASSGGLGRSNTLPSKRSPTASPMAFRGGDHTPVPGSLRVSGPTAEKNLIARSPSAGGQLRENTSHLPAVSATSVMTRPAQPRLSTPPRTAPPPQEGPQVQPRAVTTPTKERNFANFFSGLSPESHDRLQRPGNKLRKKRVTPNQSAESSTTTLPEGGNPNNVILQNGHGPVPTSHSVHSLQSLGSPPVPHSIHPPSTSHSTRGAPPESTPKSPPTTGTASMLNYFGVSQQGTAHSPAASSATLMPAMSPTPSATSSVTSQSSSHEYSDTTNPSSSPEKKPSKWRLSGQIFDNPPTSPTFSNGHGSTGSLAERIRQASRSPPHRTRSTSGSGETYLSDSEERRTAFGWLTKKVYDHKHSQQQHEQEKQHKHERTLQRREEMKVETNNLPRAPRPLAIPSSPRVQPPTPSALNLLATPVDENPAEPNSFWKDRQVHRGYPMHSPRSSEEKEQTQKRESQQPLKREQEIQQPLKRESQQSLKQESQQPPKRESQNPRRPESQAPRRQEEAHGPHSQQPHSHGEVHQPSRPVNQLPRRAESQKPRKLENQLPRRPESQQLPRQDIRQLYKPENQQLHMPETQLPHTLEGHRPQRQEIQQLHRPEIQQPHMPESQLPHVPESRQLQMPESQQFQKQQIKQSDTREIQQAHVLESQQPQVAEGQQLHRRGSRPTHKQETPALVSELPLYAPVPGESIEPEGRRQGRRRPQAIRSGERVPDSLPGTAL